jgi:protein SCO1/2
MRRCAEAFAAACIALLLAATPAAPGARADVPKLDERAALRDAEAAIGRAVPELTLRDRQGRAVPLSRYRGKPLLVSFIYTGCFQICPLQTRALDQAVKGLAPLVGSERFNVVSIGFNQPFDTPDAMRAFAAQHRIQHANWEFLSPAREQVRDLTQAFGFSFVETPAGFDHVLGVSIVDAAGRIQAQVYGDKLRADQIGAPLRRLLLDGSAAGSGGKAPSTLAAVAAVIERVRILCTVYDPETGEYRYDWKLIFEIIGGLLFFSSVAVYLLLEWRDQRRRRRLEEQPCAASCGSAA